MISKVPWDIKKPIVKSTGHWINVDLKSQSLAEDKIYVEHVQQKQSPENKIYVFSTLTKQLSCLLTRLRKREKRDYGKDSISFDPWHSAFWGK